MKLCEDCGKKIRKKTRSRRCVPCRRARHQKQLRDYRTDGRYRKQYARWRQKDPKGTWLSQSWTRVKSRSSKIGVPFKRHDIEAPDRCPVLGIELDYTMGKANIPKPESPSFDRFKPSLGYVPGNVKIISMRANMIKADANAEEIAKVLRYVRRLERETDTIDINS